MFLIRHILTEVSELQGFAKEIHGKVSTFELLRPVRTYIKKCTKN